MTSYLRETLVLHSVTPDLMPADAPLEAWSNGRNAVFRNTETVAASQDRDIFTSLVQNARTMVYVEPFDSGFWIIANENGIWATEGTNVYDITPVSWTAAGGGVWTSCVVNGLAVVNCSTDDPVYWDGQVGNVMQPLPDWPDQGRCLAMRAHKNFLVAIGFISEGGQRVRWSDAAEAGSIPLFWTPAADNLAGFVDLAPLSSSCVDGITQRDDFVIFKRESLWAMSFIGGNAVFAFRKMFAERGAAATNGVTRGPNDELLFIGSDGDVYLSDGVNVQSVLDGRAQRTFYADFQDPAGGVFSAVTLMREKAGLIIYPAAGDSSGTVALVLDFASGDIGFREMPAVLCAAEGRMLEDVGTQNEWDGDAGAWDSDATAWNSFITAASVEDVLFGTESGQKLFAGGELSLPVSVEKSGMSFGNPQMRKVMMRLWPKVIGRKGDVLSFRLGGQETAGGPVSLSDPVVFVVGENNPLDMFASGRFLYVSVECTDQVAPWRLGSMDIEFREAGGW